MNWYQGENDIRAKFDESEAGARRSNELRQLDELRLAGASSRSNGLTQLRARIAGVWAQLVRRKPAARPARSGSAQPRAARAFRQK